MSEPGRRHPPEEAGESLAEASGQGIFLETYYGAEGPEASPDADDDARGLRRA